MQLQRVELADAEGPGRDLVVGCDGGRARPVVENRQFAERRAWRECGKADVAILRGQPHTGMSPRYQEQIRTWVSPLKDNAAGRPLPVFQIGAQPSDMIGRELAQQRGIS